VRTNGNRLPALLMLMTVLCLSAMSALAEEVFVSRVVGLDENLPAPGSRLFALYMERELYEAAGDRYSGGCRCCADYC